MMARLTAGPILVLPLILRQPGRTMSLTCSQPHSTLLVQVPRTALIWELPENERLIG
jgi:hypothetical protein